MEKDFKFKISKVKGKIYLQIWNGNDFLITAGSPESLYKKLVEREELKKRTNLLKEKLTNLTKGENLVND